MNCTAPTPPLYVQGFNIGSAPAGGTAAWPLPVPRHGPVTRQRRSARRTAEPVIRTGAKRMADADWQDTVSLLLTRVNDLSGRCPVGVSCDAATGPLHPTIADLRRAVARDFKVVADAGLGEHRSLDGVIVLIAESNHYQPEDVMRALRPIWRPGDLHFVELPEPYVRSGKMNHYLHGIPALQEEAEGGSVGMDDHELGVRVERAMGQVAGGLLDLIDALVGQMYPEVPPVQREGLVETLQKLRLWRDALWTDYQALRPEPHRAQQNQITRLRQRAGELEGELHRLIVGTMDSRSDFMAQSILDRVQADLCAGASPRRAYVAVSGVEHLQRLAERLQQSGHAYVLLCPRGISASIDACH